MASCESTDLQWTYKMHPHLTLNEHSISNEFRKAMELITEIHDAYKSLSDSQYAAESGFSFHLTNSGGFSIKYNKPPSPPDPHTRRKAFYDRLYEYIAEAIYESNMQASAGLAFDETHQLVITVLCGEAPDPAKVYRNTHKYERHAASLRKARGLTTVPSRRKIIQARREVIQHAQAMLHLCKNWVDKPLDEPLREDLVKETHQILCDKLPAYAALVHTTNATNHRPQDPTPLAHLLESFNANLKTSLQDTHALDPFYLAAGLAQDFVLAQQFAVGNQRMGRLLLNAVLMKFVGVGCPSGEEMEVECGGHGDGDDCRCSDGHGHENQECEGEKQARSQLASKLLKGSVRVLRGLREALD